MAPLKRRADCTRQPPATPQKVLARRVRVLYNSPRLLGPLYSLNYFEEGVPMSRIFAVVAGVLMSVSQALANEPKSGAPDYSGISGIYYTLIGLILVYGVYDTFFKKS
jgi:hypothetical protein